MCVNGATPASVKGKSRRAMISFMCGTAEVAIAMTVESVGQTEIEDGENVTYAFECGARFCDPRCANTTGSLSGTVLERAGTS